MKNIQRWILAIPYIFFPIIGIIARFSGRESILTRNWIDLVWLLLLLVSIYHYLFQKSKEGELGKSSIIYLLTATISLLLANFFIKYGLSFLDHSTSFVPYLMELKPIFYGIVGIMLVWSFGKPKNSDFVKMGAWLGAILVVEFVVESLIAGKIVRILGSGEINYDAALLIISACALLENSGENSGWKKPHILLIYLGIFTTFSRTALATVVLIMLLFIRGGLILKVIMSVLGVGLLKFSYVIRGLSVQIVSADRYWMWLTAYRLFEENPWMMFLGFPVGVELPIEIPPPLLYLWSLQQVDWGLSGVYQFNFHAFWLRIALSWGIPIALGILIICVGVVLFPMKNARDLKGLATFCIVGGLTMGLFYLSNVSIPLFLAIFTFSNMNISQRKICKQ